jgi:hypothetical protein
LTDTKDREAAVDFVTYFQAGTLGGTGRFVSAMRSLVRITGGDYEWVPV